MLLTDTGLRGMAETMPAPFEPVFRYFISAMDTSRVLSVCSRTMQRKWCRAVPLAIGLT
jgi:hypothetical protein